MDTKKLQLYFFIGLLLAVTALTVALFEPFIAPIALAFMAAVVMRPLHDRLLREVGGRRTLASFLSVLFVLVVIIVPLGILIQQITLESYNFYVDVREQGLGGFDHLTWYFIHPVQKFYPAFDPDIPGYIKSVAGGFVSNASHIFSSTASIALSAFIAIVAFFYMLRDGHAFRKLAVRLSPLADDYDNDIIDKIERAVNSVVRGSLFTSLVKGLLATAGFAIFGVSHAILWGMLTAIVSLLPGIGAGLTIIPAVLYLAALDKTGMAIGLAVWGIVAVGLVDNILMPFIVGKGFTVHPLLVLLSVIGGIAFFGPVGLFLGPLVIALFAALLEIYKLIILDDQNKKITQV
jgi:predicted PurR-regulated permease PerM